jgi:hypothetical protein
VEESRIAKFPDGVRAQLTSSSHPHERYFETALQSCICEAAIQDYGPVFGDRFAILEAHQTRCALFEVLDDCYLRCPDTSCSAAPGVFYCAWFSFFGTKFLSDKSYTTSSTSLTLYFSPSLRRRRLSFLRLRIWKPACKSLTNWLMSKGRS